MPLHRGYRIFRVGVTALAVVISIAAVRFSESGHVSLSQLSFLMAVAILCELTPVAFGSTYAEVTLMLPLLVMAMLVHGPLAVVILSSAAFICASVMGWTSAYLVHHYPVPEAGPTGLLFAARRVLFRKVLQWIGRPWEGRHAHPFWWMVSNLVYNASHYCLNAAIASFVYILAGGKILTHDMLLSGLSPYAWTRTVCAAVLAVAVFFVSDAAVYAAFRTLHDTSPGYSKTWNGFLVQWNIMFRQTSASMFRSDIILALLGAVLTYLYVNIGPAAIIALFGSLYMIRDAVGQTFQQIQSYRDTVTTLGTYMQRYHPYTRGHLKRVADMSERLARELRLPIQSVMMMPDAGMLHDIGKVGVSEDILDKIGKLSDDEWAVIKQHPEKGAEIVSHLPFLDKIVDWVKYHHKWADGSGYPDDGKKDGEIPVEASIIAVADAFDAMTDDRDLSVDWRCDACGYQPENGMRPEICPECGMQKKRVYREPLTMEEAIDQLRRGAGTQFSPPVVKAFLRMVDRDGVHIDA